MNKYYVLKDGKVEATTATKEGAIDLVRAYQKRETHPILKANFSIIYGEEEFIPYNEKPKQRIKDNKRKTTDCWTHYDKDDCNCFVMVD